jgi:hypothetical protein
MVEMFPQGLELASSPSQNPLSYQLRQQHACEILSALNIYSFKKIHRFGEYKYSLTHRIFNFSDFFLTQNRLSLSARSLTLSDLFIVPFPAPVAANGGATAPE